MTDPTHMDYHRAFYALELLRHHQGKDTSLFGVEQLHKAVATNVEWSLMLDRGLKRLALVIPGSNDGADWRYNLQFRLTGYIPGALGRQFQAQVARILNQPKDDATEIVHDSAKVQPHAGEPGSEEWADHKVHRGFYSLYEGIKVELRTQAHNFIQQHPDCDLWVAAHSMGAAVGVLAALDVQYNAIHATPAVYLFGAPRLGNAPFVAEYNERLPETVRVVNGFDMVTIVPPRLAGYVHVGELMPIGATQAEQVVPRVSDHPVEAYYAALTDKVRAV